MTCAQRIRSLRLMEKMEKAYHNGNDCVERANDGTLQYKNENGNILFEAKMKGSE